MPSGKKTQGLFCEGQNWGGVSEFEVELGGASELKEVCENERRGVEQGIVLVAESVLALAQGQGGLLSVYRVDFFRGLFFCFVFGTRLRKLCLDVEWQVVELVGEGASVSPRSRRKGVPVPLRVPR